MPRKRKEPHVGPGFISMNIPTSHTSRQVRALSMWYKWYSVADLATALASEPSTEVGEREIGEHRIYVQIPIPVWARFTLSCRGDRPIHALGAQVDHWMEKAAEKRDRMPVRSPWAELDVLSLDA